MASLFTAAGAARRSCGFRRYLLSRTIGHHNRALDCVTPCMHAYVYKSQRRADTYVYLAERDGFSRLPESLRTGLGRLRFVLEVALTPERRLASQDPAEVRANLVARGFHLQFAPLQSPPSAAGDPLRQDRGTDA